jgi:heme-degrading monooxygenase HmoA
MFARLVRFSLPSGERAVAQAVADQLAPQIAEQPGCHGVTVFGAERDGDYGIFVLWETQDDADSAARVIRPVLDKHLSGKVTQPPETRLFEVFS